MANATKEQSAIYQTDGSLPPNPVAPQGQVSKLPISAVQKTSEYTAGSTYSWLGPGFFRTLPKYIDDITADYPDVYESMMFDSQVSSSYNLIKLGILVQGVRITNRFPEKDPRNAASKPIVEFCQRNLDYLHDPFPETLWQLLDGMAFGYKVAEQTYQLMQGGQDDGKLCLDTIRVKPRWATAFVMDPYSECVGILAVLPGMPAYTTLNSGLVASTSSDARPIPNLLPRSKFVVFTYRPREGDPRGTSILRPAYDPWYVKNQIKQLYLKYLAMCAVPSVIGVTSPEADNVQVTDANGTPLLDAEGNATYKNPEQQLLDTLISFQAGSAAAVPPGTSIEFAQSSEHGQVFDMAFSFVNNEIVKAITGQTLATSEGTHQSRSASETHHDVLDMPILAGKTALSHCLERDMLTPLVSYNFGAEAARSLLPRVEFPDNEQRDYAAKLTALTMAVGVGLVVKQQFPGIWSKFNLPEVDLADVPDPPHGGGQRQDQGGMPGIRQGTA